MAMAVRARPLAWALRRQEWGRRRTLTGQATATAATPSTRPNVTWLSRYFNPISSAEKDSGKSSPSSALNEPGSADEALEILTRGGYITQSSSGVFTLLPSGYKILRKIERIVDEEMSAIGASRLDMPTLLSNKLWKKSGRDEAMGSELYRLKDRKGTDWILAPTHEEEVTKVVGSTITSYKQLPVKVYQMTRKHRDEPRPRLGLLRTREFVMKDLYTFDTCTDTATASYRDVRGAYTRIMDRLFPGAWRVAEADTGAMGGKLSHEYHVQDPSGEDDLVVCSNAKCHYTANAELATSKPTAEEMPVVADDVQVRLYAQSDDPSFAGKLTVLVSSATSTINEVKVNNLLAQRRTATTAAHRQIFPPPQSGETHWDWKDRPDGPLVRFDSIEIIADHACCSLSHEDVESAVVDSLLRYALPHTLAAESVDEEQTRTASLSHFFHLDDASASSSSSSSSSSPLPITYHDVRLAQDGHSCTQCNSALQSVKSIEVGHTFLLGERYSSVLGHQFAAEPRSEVRAGGKQVQVQERKFVQMGCYGLGVTRLLGVLAIHARRAFLDAMSANTTTTGAAASSTAATPSGLLWPHHMAPFNRVILQASNGQEARNQTDSLLLTSDDDAVLVDDRPHVSIGQKKREADLYGAQQVWIVGGKAGEPEVVRQWPQ